VTRRLVGTSFYLGLALASLLAIVAVNVPARAQPPGGDDDLPAV